ncbi:BTAD domain-containing putative transcriptional regulator [Streptomyces sp. SBT349]|uniref:BTAD domain-containing putative transcriptional regulator n=1 Tax=Streptomyces sp. SBT349 TaxID=1580539 RepID=UPI0007C86B78|nr:BTAD domain-containing putative transcriptional regulator [Streptomyces sp. SBT349]
MRFGVLGPLAVWTDEGTPVIVPDTKVRALLTDLLANGGGPVSADRLIEDLWGARPPRNPAGTLQARVSQLRRALAEAEPGGRELLELGAAGYALRARGDAVDAGAFAALVARAEETGEPRARAALLGEALDLWRGPAFADFADEPFAAAAVARLEEQRLTAVEGRAEARLALGEHDALTGELAELVARHPLRERLRAAQMRALYRAGRQDAALAAYRELRDALADELGVDPRPELAELHRAVLNHDPALAPRARTNLPTPLSDLIGREEAVAGAGERLGAARLLTLTGPGGVGKTRLALAVAAEATGEFADGVWLVELAAASGPGVKGAVAAVLGVRDDAVPGGPLGERLAEVLADRRTLLVLDNCEHVVEPVAALASRLLKAAPGLRILATGREPLGVNGEVVEPVEPLGLPPDGAGAGAGASEEYSAVRLFVTRAAAVAPGFALDAGNAAAVAAVCRRLDGIPLALELAATRVRALGVEELAGRLDDRFRLPAGGPRDAPPRRRTLRAVLDWSWDLLSEPERAVLRRLAVHRDGCTIEAAEAVASHEVADVVEMLTRLVDRSLVAVVDGRFRLLESVAAYALERLVEAGEEDAVRRLHAAFYGSLAERAAGHLRGRDQFRWMDRLDPEAANLRGALAWAAGAGEAERALRLVNALSWYWFLRGRVGEARRALTTALAAPGTAPAALRAEAVAWHAGLAGPGGESGAEGVAVRAAYAGVDDPLGRARAEWFVVLTRWAFGDLREHEARVNGALETFRALGDRWGTAAALSTRAKLALGRADLAAIERDGRRSLELFDELGDAWGRLEALYALDVVAEVAGDYERAAGLRREGLRLAEELGLWAEVSFRLSGLGRLALLAGDLDRAWESHERALRLAVAHSATAAQEFAELGLGLVARRQGRLDVAEGHLRAWLSRLGGAEGTAGTAFVLAQLGYVAEQRGEPERALRLHREGYETARATGDPRAVALALEGLAGARALGGDAAHAARLLGAASAAREAVGAPLPPAERADVDRAEAAARSALGEAAFARERATGGGLSPDAATVELADGVLFPEPGPGETWAVGVVILNGRGEAFAQRRSASRRLFPDCWDLVGGHVEEGETLLDTLAREVAEETGWRVRRVARFLGVITWEGDDGLGLRHEADYVVEVDGDLSAPELEWAKHPSYDWFAPDDLERLKENRVPADQLVHAVIVKALSPPPSRT